MLIYLLLLLIIYTFFNIPILWGNHIILLQIKYRLHANPKVHVESTFHILVCFWLSMISKVAVVVNCDHIKQRMQVVNLFPSSSRHEKACDVKHQPKNNQPLLTCCALVLCTLSFVRSPQFLARFSLYTFFQVYSMVLSLCQCFTMLYFA